MCREKRHSQVNENFAEEAIIHRQGKSALVDHKRKGGFLSLTGRVWVVACSINLHQHAEKYYVHNIFVDAFCGRFATCFIHRILQTTTCANILPPDRHEGNGDIKMTILNGAVQLWIGSPT